MDTGGQTGSARRIGAIFVEKGHISEEQLALALEEQQATGQKLGEILVASYGISRLDLAGVLAERWTEDEPARTSEAAVATAPAPSGGGETQTAATSVADGVPPGIQAVLAQLEEAVGRGVALKRTTDDLGYRLAAVELVLGALTEAFEELREASAARLDDTPAKSASVTEKASRIGSAATRGDLLRQLALGPKKGFELRQALAHLDESVLHSAVADGVVGTRATTLDRSSKRSDDEYYLTSAGASEIGEDPDQHPWPFHG